MQKRATIKQINIKHTTFIVHKHSTKNGEISNMNEKRRIKQILLKIISIQLCSLRADCSGARNASTPSDTLA